MFLDRETGRLDTLVAFSGTVKDPDTGAEYTEPAMNVDGVSGKPIGEKQLPERFASPDYNRLLVANKYQTGFDQPLLCAMYVDKRLDGVQAVQTLSRLNRCIPGKEEPFVLDFVNEAEDIYRAFKPYYDATSLQEGSDPHQSEFREKLSGYVRIYAFLSQIMPYTDPALEMLYSFGRLLLPHLPFDREVGRVKIRDEVGLLYYRMQRLHAGAIELREGAPEGVKSPTEVGTGKTVDEPVRLSEIIQVLNARFGTNFTEEDRLFFEQIREKAARSEQVVQLRRANPFDKFQLGLRQILESLMIQRMTDNDKIVTRYMDDKEFGETAFAVLSKSIYDSIPATTIGMAAR